MLPADSGYCNSSGAKKRQSEPRRICYTSPGRRRKHADGDIPRLRCTGRQERRKGRSSRPLQRARSYRAEARPTAGDKRVS